MLTVKETAELLSLSEQRIRALIKAGKLPAEKHGRDWAISPESLEIVRQRKPGRPAKLSEAIRIGALIRPQSTNGYFGYCENGELGSCALGAAYEALSQTFVDPHAPTAFTMPGLDAVANLFKIDATAQIPNPDRNNALDNLLGVVIDMNDGLKLPREAIADYIAQFGY